VTLLFAAAHPLVHVNATLNAIAAVLLIVGLVMIKQGRVWAHKRVMLTAFGVSIVFLLCYLWYHYQVGSVQFTHPGFIRYIYLMILLTHILLAVTVPFLAIWTIYLGLRATGSFGRGDPAATGEDLAVYRAKHRRLARWTYPIWLYVSVTGVVVYVMLYHLWPPANL
jgi:putative membrane protein